MKNRLNETASETIGARNEEFLKFIGKNNLKNKFVLDIGCGTGWFEHQNKNIVKKIWAIDVDIKHVNQNKNFFKNKNIEFMVASGLDIPLRDGDVDVIVTSEVIEHIPKDRENIFFKEVYRVLKNKGKLFISTPYKNWRSQMLDPAWYWGHRHYSLEFLSSQARLVGLKRKKYKIVGSWWTAIGLLNMYIAKWIFKRKKFFNNFFDTKEKIENQANGFMNLFIAFEKIKGDGVKRL